jgi:rhodanese-related sulfurtransferase/DNA-binding HxlR family transcriptional regulator
LTIRAGEEQDPPVGDRAAKRKLFDGFGAVAKALGSGRRTEILDVLSQGPRSVEDLSAEIDQSVANTSHHLRTMARAGLLQSDRDGTHVVYRVASPKVTELWRALRDVAAEQVAEIDRLARGYLGDRDGLEPVPREELVRRLRRRDVVLLDVRPTAEYRAGHIAGARSIPIEELTRRLRGVSKDSRVVAYCRGPYCVFADDAVRTLRRRGYQAARLEDGFPEWRDAGLPVEVGTGT